MIVTSMKTMAMKMMEVFKWLMNLQKKKKKKKYAKVKKNFKIETWIRNISKNSRALGLEHTSIRGVHVMPRSAGPDCKYRNKCFTKMNI